MPSTELQDLIVENRALRAELRAHREKRRDEIARRFRSSLGEGRRSAIGIAETRLLRMTSLLLDAHRTAVRDEEGLTIDLITDALEHLSRRLEREVLPRYE